MLAQKLDILDQDCYTRLTLELIGDKWTVLLLHALGNSIRRYSELKQIVDGITHKMLTQTLRKLEQDGLVERIVYPVVPPKVEYRLTELGKTLIPILNMLCDWADKNFQDVLDSRAQTRLTIE